LLKDPVQKQLGKSLQYNSIFYFSWNLEIWCKRIRIWEKGTHLEVKWFDPPKWDYFLSGKRWCRKWIYMVYSINVIFNCVIFKVKLHLMESFYKIIFYNITLYCIHSKIDDEYLTVTHLTQFTHFRHVCVLLLAAVKNCLDLSSCLICFFFNLWPKRGRGRKE